MEQKHAEQLKRIGETLKQLREEKGITLYKIEKTTKLSFHTLKAIETGKYGYSLETLFIYLDAISVDMDIIFK